VYKIIFYTKCSGIRTVDAMGTAKSRQRQEPLWYGAELGEAPGHQVTRDTGIKIAAVSSKQVIEDIADAMVRLGDDSGLSAELKYIGTPTYT
jgi:hypothetical protein